MRDDRHTYPVDIIIGEAEFELWFAEHELALHFFKSFLIAKDAPVCYITYLVTGVDQSFKISNIYKSR